MQSNLIEILPCDTQGYYFNNSGQRASTPSVLANVNTQIDDEAIYSVLQFGTIIPPLSPWKGIHRYLPGYRYEGTNVASPIELPKKAHISSLNLEQQADEVEKLLDSILKTHIGNQKDPVLLFSGGVDSGIIASRLIALGYRESLLLNFSFGDNDSESKLAEAMAKELGLKFERISCKRRAANILANPGKIYSQPFGDHSTVPTSDLAYSVNEYLRDQKRLIIDGTGADGAFGMTAKIHAWERLERIPKITKRVAAFAYRKSLWQDSSRIEYITRLLRRSLEMSPLSALLSQNPLAGIFYEKSSMKSVNCLLEKWIGGWAGDSFATRVVAADLAMVGANIFAQKAKPILESAGHKVLFPFLDIEMVSTALSSIPYWQMNEPKAPLKISLSRHVDYKRVFRPKSGFIDPKSELFYNSEFIEYLRSSAETTGPFSHLLKKKPIIKSCELLARNKALPFQTLNLLWALVFTDRWYRTVFQ